LIGRSLRSRRLHHIQKGHWTCFVCFVPASLKESEPLQRGAVSGRGFSHEQSGVRGEKLKAIGANLEPLADASGGLALFAERSEKLGS
jgi:hypothetical protein